MTSPGKKEGRDSEHVKWEQMFQQQQQQKGDGISGPFDRVESEESNL